MPRIQRQTMNALPDREPVERISRAFTGMAKLGNSANHPIVAAALKAPTIQGLQSGPREVTL